jgi:integrase
MAYLRQDRAGNYVIAFRYPPGRAGRQYNRSLGTKDRRTAVLGLKRLDGTLDALRLGLLAMPAEAEPGEFLLSGGARSLKPARAPLAAEPMTIAKIFEQWKATAKNRENTMRTIQIHHAHISRLLGANKPIEAVTCADLQGYVDARAKEAGKNGKVQSYTIRKELRRFRQTWEWGRRNGVCSAPEWRIADLALEPDQGREPFRTFEEIKRRIGRGGVTKQQERRLWECLYLTGDDVKDVLNHVRKTATASWVYPLFAFCVMTGARRSEMLRSQIDDWDFETRIVHIRELKRDKRKQFTMRAVEIHPILAEVMSDRFGRHPGGQLAICQENGQPVSGDLADHHLDRTLAAHQKWCHIRGFHTFRHSFASLLAATNTDQRTIDALMGHQTEDMRRRYQHIFPPKKRRAIDSLLP